MASATARRVSSTSSSRPSSIPRLVRKRRPASTQNKSHSAISRSHISTPRSSIRLWVRAITAAVAATKAAQDTQKAAEKELEEAKAELDRFAVLEGANYRHDTTEAVAPFEIRLLRPV